MHYLLWGLLNIGLLISFIIICFKASRFVREKMGWLAAFIFVLGLLAFSSSSNSNQVKTWHFNSPDSVRMNSTAVSYVDLEETFFLKHILGIWYGKDKQLHKNIPVSAIAFTNGFVSVTSWKPIAIHVNRTQNNQKFAYVVAGTITWSLLGIPIYTQPKSWKGTAALE